MTDPIPTSAGLRLLDAISIAAEDQPTAAYGLVNKLAWIVDTAPFVDQCPTASKTDQATLAALTSDLVRKLATSIDNDEPLTDFACRVSEAVRDSQELDGVNWIPDARASLVICRVVGDCLQYVTFGDVSVALAGMYRIFIADDTQSVQVEQDALTRERLSPAISASDGLAARANSWEPEPRRRRPRTTIRNPHLRFDKRSTVAHDARSGYVSLHENDRLLICNGGLSRLIHLFEAYDSWRGLVEAITDSSLADQVMLLRRLEAAHPADLSFRRLRTHDDATGLLFAAGG